MLNPTYPLCPPPLGGPGKSEASPRSAEFLEFLAKRRSYFDVTHLAHDNDLTLEVALWSWVPLLFWEPEPGPGGNHPYAGVVEFKGVVVRAANESAFIAVRLAV